MAIKYKDMAIEFKKINEKLEKSPLSKDELALIDKAEEYIDKQIVKQFKGGDVMIDLCIADFRYNTSVNQTTNLPDARRILMNKELERRYKQAGWKISLHYDDGLDGPNMSGPDYWILTGKGK